jgi:NTE family protein
VGLVLGAGGTLGCAYHAGVLASLAHHLDWDARDAASIVGTSAGSLVAALVRCGVAPDEMALLMRDGPADRLPARLRPLHDASTAPMPSTTQLLRAIRPPTPAGLCRSARSRSPRPALVSMLRPGRVDLAELTRLLDELGVRARGASWPRGDLRICAVSARTGRLRVLDDGAGVDLSTAVAASCAVPGLFAPQAVEGDLLVDGGMRSVTNADVLPFDDLDEVWVVAPMAGATFSGLAAGIGARIRGALRRELRAAPRDMPIRVFAPGEEARTAMGLDLMRRDRTGATVLAGFLEAGDLAATAFAA